MNDKQRQGILSALKSVLIACGGLVLLLVVALILLMVLSNRSARSQAVKAELQRATEQSAAAITVGQELVGGIAASERATINGAQYFDNADEAVEYLSVYWLGDDGLVKRGGPASPQIIVSDGQSYNYSLVVKVERRTAQNVRAYVRIPSVAKQGETARLEVLITADNAMPYYEAIDLTANPTSIAETDPAPDLLLNYHEGSAALHSNALVDGTQLDARALLADENGVLLGANQMDGIIPTGDDSLCIVSWTIDAVAKDDATEVEESEKNVLWNKYKQSLEASKP